MVVSGAAIEIVEVMVATMEMEEQAATTTTTTTTTTLLLVVVLVAFIDNKKSCIRGNTDFPATCTAINNDANQEKK